MLGTEVVRMWITNKNEKEMTGEMIESVEDFLSVSIRNGCIGSTFAEDEERIIVYTRWMDEMTLEQFRTSEDYKTKEGGIIQSFIDAGFDIPEDILFNSTAKILFSNYLVFAPLIAVLVGFIPGCGPQIIITSIYLMGVIPLSAQIGNAISNDGDALFPVLAIAPKVGLVATLYSAIPALIISYGFLLIFE